MATTYEKRLLEGTGDELRQKAAEREERAAESFERCDTDGFLSQWASGITAQQLRAQAKIADAGGTALFTKTVLVTLEGEAVDARICETRFGTKYRIDATDEWIKFTSTDAALAKRGYKRETIAERAGAKAIIAGSGTGLAGAASCYVAIIRTDGAKGWGAALEQA